MFYFCNFFFNMFVIQKYTMKKQMLSIRISSELKKKIQSICEEKKISESEYLISIIAPKVSVANNKMNDFMPINKEKQVMSFRVPLDFKKNLMDISKSKGISLSKYILSELNSIHNQDFENSKNEELEKISDGHLIKIPEKLYYTLTNVGGLTIGVNVYNALKKSMNENPEFDDDKIVAISIMAGVFSTQINKNY